MGNDIASSVKSEFACPVPGPRRSICSKLDVYSKLVISKYSLSSVGQETNLKHTANGNFFMCKYLPCYLYLLIVIIMLLPVILDTFAQRSKYQDSITPCQDA